MLTMKAAVGWTFLLSCSAASDAEGWNRVFLLQQDSSLFSAVPGAVTVAIEATNDIDSLFAITRPVFYFVDVSVAMKTPDMCLKPLSKFPEGLDRLAIFEPAYLSIYASPEGTGTFPGSACAYALQVWKLVSAVAAISEKPAFLISTERMRPAAVAAVVPLNAAGAATLAASSARFQTAVSLNVLVETLLTAETAVLPSPSLLCPADSGPAAAAAGNVPLSPEAASLVASGLRFLGIDADARAKFPTEAAAGLWLRQHMQRRLNRDPGAPPSDLPLRSGKQIFKEMAERKRKLDQIQQQQLQEQVQQEQSASQQSPMQHQEVPDQPKEKVAAVSGPTLENEADQTAEMDKDSVDHTDDNIDGDHDEVEAEEGEHYPGLAEPASAVAAVPTAPASDAPADSSDDGLIRVLVDGASPPAAWDPLDEFFNDLALANAQPMPESLPRSGREEACIISPLGACAAGLPT